MGKKFGVIIVVESGVETGVATYRRDGVKKSQPPSFDVLTFQAAYTELPQPPNLSAYSSHSSRCSIP